MLLFTSQHPLHLENMPQNTSLDFFFFFEKELLTGMP